MPGAGINRSSPSPSPAPSPSPCKSKEDAWNAAVDAQRVTQRTLNTINSKALEDAIKATGNTALISAWETEVTKATKANNKAVKKVNDTYTKYMECTASQPGAGTPR